MVTGSSLCDSGQPEMCLGRGRAWSHQRWRRRV